MPAVINRTRIQPAQEVEKVLRSATLVGVVVVVLGVGVWLVTRPVVAQSHVFTGIVGLGTLVALGIALAPTRAVRCALRCPLWRARLSWQTRGLCLRGIDPKEVARQRAAIGEFRGSPANLVNTIKGFLDSKQDPSTVQAYLKAALASFRSRADCAEVMMQWGEALKRQSRNDQAERALRLAHDLKGENQDNPGIHVNLATVQRYLRKYNDARETLEEAEHLWPGNQWVLWNLSLLLKTQFPGETKRAIELLERLAESGYSMADGEILINRNLGELYMLDDREDRAEAAFRAALDASRVSEFKQGRILAVWGDALEDIGRLRDAVEKWAEAEPFLEPSERPPQRWLRHVRQKLSKYRSDEAAA